MQRCTDRQASRVQEFVGFLDPEDGTDRLSRNVATRHIIPYNGAVLIPFTAEAH